ncbi:MAG: dihydrofolate reductase family protein [Candidatus Heimdallarchaeota archaeon]|nr:dihydrofolate reductase family protein [Candidatus Heimdallarchaeota archaeon]MCK4768845.1 dihydrofolate reductase family protein [Candidatus Heimdallarchaeota archaeon]
MEELEVIINVACSLDGVIASNKGALILSTTEDWLRVHKLRNSVDAILVGVNTIIKDDSLLTVRYVKPKDTPPLRVVLDSKCRTPLSAQIFDKQESIPTVIFTSKNCPEEKKKKITDLKVTVIPVDTKDETKFLDLRLILQILKNDFKVKKLLVEGGSAIITQFIKLGLFDTMYIFYAPVFAGTKKAKLLYDEIVIDDIADTNSFNITKVEKFDEGILLTIKPQEDDK